MAQRLRAFAEGGGNLLLTDDSLRGLGWMGLVPGDAIQVKDVYAGHLAFTTDGGGNSTYEDPLAANMNPPGSAEGVGRRKQITEPVPLGYDLDGGGSMPQWYVDTAAFTEAGGRVAGTEGTGSSSAERVSLGEIELGAGRVRILGSFLPWPTTEFPHNSGLASYSVTFNGYELAKNLLSWERPAG